MTEQIVNTKMETVNPEQEENDVQLAAGEAYDLVEILLNKVRDDGNAMLHKLVEEHGIEMMSEAGFKPDCSAHHIMGDDIMAYATAKWHLLTASVMLSLISSGRSEEALEIAKRKG